MSFWNSLKCAAGYHELSPWNYLQDGSCDQKQKCLRDGCKYEEARSDHHWSAFKYESDNSCKENRTCSRCGEVETREEHSIWSQPEYVSSDKCDTTSQCERCGQIEKDVKHRWEVWQYKSPKSCRQVRFCRVCHAEELKTLSDNDHDWGANERVTCRQDQRICRRCSKSELISNPFFPRHIWGPWERAGYKELERRCKDCPATESKSAT